jgi:adenylate cyclase
MKKLLLLLAVLSLPLLFQFDTYQILKLKTFDAFVQAGVPSNYFAVLSITEEDVDREGGYPLPRLRLAEIQTKLLEKGAIGVGWGIAFPHPDRLGGDEEFAASMNNSRTVLPLFENDNGEYPDTVGTVILGDGTGGYTAKGTTQNILILKQSQWTDQGIASAPVDVDNLVRRIPLLYRTPDGWLAAFGTQVLKSLVGADTYVIKTNENGIEEIRVKGLPPVKVDSLGRKWVSWIVPHETSLAEMDVEGRFVFVGVTAAGVMPQLATPVGLLEPHYIQAALAESILQENSPYIPDYALAVEAFAYVVTVITVWLAINLLGVTWGVIAALLCMVLTCSAGVYLINKGVLIDVTWALIAQFIATSIAFYLNFRKQFKLRQQIKKQFEHYLDPRQVKQLQKNPELLRLGGEKRYATFLFTDVRGFTSLSETLPPEQVTYIMNKALTAQQKAVQKYEGMVDKYIGDAMMAIFNAPLDQAEHENKAVECALEIVKNMELLNIELVKEGLPSIAIGIGVNTGEAVIGNMGSESRFDYTAIGDAVNTAARLESATKEQQVDILIGESTANTCKYSLDFVANISVKGKEQPLKVYTYGF